MANNGFLRFAPFVLSAGLVVGGLVVPGVVTSGWHEEEEALRASVNTVRAETDSVKDENQSAMASVVQEATGVDKSRYRRDGENIREFLRISSTWSSCKEYNAARTRAQEKYGVADDSSFFTDYMPYMPESSHPEYDGTTKGDNMIDSRGLNLALGDVEVYMADTDGSNIRYFAKFETHSTDGEHESGRDSLFMCSVDSDGKISDASAVFLT